MSVCPRRLCPDWVRDAYPGMWVAMAGDDVLAVRESSMDLVDHLSTLEGGSSGLFVLRVPRHDDPEMVGPG